VRSRRDLRVLCVNPRPGEEFYVLSEPWSRSGETASPKRDIVVMCDVFACFVALSRLD